MPSPRSPPCRPPPTPTAAASEPSCATSGTCPCRRTRMTSADMQAACRHLQHPPLVAHLLKLNSGNQMQACQFLKGAFLGRLSAVSQLVSLSCDGELVLGEVNFQIHLYLCSQRARPQKPVKWRNNAYFHRESDKVCHPHGCLHVCQTGFSSTDDRSFAAPIVGHVL